MARQSSFSLQESQEKEDLDKPSIYEFSWQVNAYLNGYIQFADAKAGAIVTFFTVVLGLYTGFWPEPNRSGWFWVGVAVSLLPIITALLVITPRLIRKDNKGAIFWEHINDFETPDQYSEALHSIDLLKEVIHHNYSLAQVAQQKYFWLRWAIYTTWGVLLYLGISFVIASL